MHTRVIHGVTVPSLIYGTAWKEEDTARLVRLALAAGFRGIDTANQRKHYHEAGVGEALADAGIARSALYLQSKFTYARGQDHRLPYDPDADFATQVRQSCASSLEHLATPWLDGYLLHGPWNPQGLAPADREVWRAMEELHAEGRVRLIGLSNVSYTQLVAFHTEARVKPAIVQNRCYARDGWDRQVRGFCREHGIGYQGFSLLTANPRELAQPAVRKIAARLGRTVPEVVFRALLALDILVLTGTSSVTHMRQDLAAGALELTPDEVRAIENIARP